MIVHPTVSNEEAKTLFPEFTIHKVGLPSALRTSLKLIHRAMQPYLRTTPLKLD